MAPLIIEAALNGGTPKSRNPHVPRSPAEIAADALACLDAGAAIIHTHIEGFAKTGDAAAAEYMAGWQPVLDARPDAIFCPTLSGGKSFDDRFGHMRTLARHGALMGIIDPGSVNLASHGDDGLPGALQFIYTTNHADIAGLMDLHAEARLGPSLAIYEPGYLRTVLAWHRAGRLPPGALVKLYFGGPYNFLDGKRSNVTFGLPPTPTALAAYLEMMEGCDLPWAVAVMGGDVTAAGLAQLAIEKGGHVRVGLEDWGGEGAPRNAELVGQVVALAGAAGRAVASCAQAAAILNLPPPLPQQA
jgi:3-keto-5-aminohexanoate cleavage enzyme